MVGTTKMEFAPTIIDPKTIPTGYESDIAKVNAKRAIAQALIEGAFNNDIPGWGGALAKIGNAWAGKSLEKQSEKLATDVNARRTAEYTDKMGKIVAALQSGDPAAMQSIIPYASDPAMKEVMAPILAGLTKRTENQNTGDATTIQTPQGIQAAVTDKTGMTHVAPGSVVPRDMKAINSTGVDMNTVANNQALPADLTDAVVNGLAPNLGNARINQPAFDAKVAISAAQKPDKFTFIPQQQGPTLVGDSSTGNLSEAPVVPVGSIKTSLTDGTHPTLLAIADTTRQMFPGVTIKSSVRTPAEQTALHAAGVTSATAATSPHVDHPGNPAHGLDLPLSIAPTEQALKAAYATKGIKVTRAVPESGKGPNQGTGPHWHVEFDVNHAPPSTAPMNSTQLNQKSAAEGVLKTIGYDPRSGQDMITPLIRASTSGYAQAAGSFAKGAITGQGTPGAEAIGKLKVFGNHMVLDILGGKLGQQISDSDRKFIEASMASIGDPTVPADVRESAWSGVVDLLKQRATGNEAYTPGGHTAKAGAAQPQSGWSIVRKH